MLIAIILCLYTSNYYTSLLELKLIYQLLINKNNKYRFIINKVIRQINK